MEKCRRSRGASAVGLLTAMLAIGRQGLITQNVPFFRSIYVGATRTNGAQTCMRCNPHENVTVFSQGRGRSNCNSSTLTDADKYNAAQLSQENNSPFHRGIGLKEPFGTVPMRRNSHAGQLSCGAIPKNLFFFFFFYPPADGEK